MPGIDLENGYTPGAPAEDSGKEDNVVLLTENTVKEEDPNVQCGKKVDKLCIDWGLVLSAITIIIAVAILFFLMVKIQYARDSGFTDVIVTPYPNQVATNDSSSIVTLPCYFPPSPDSLTFPVNCSYNAGYFCPTNYVCLYDATIFDAPYIGCVSTELNCGDLWDCAWAIDNLPNESETVKTLSLDYSYLLVIIYALILFPLSILAIVLAVVKLYKKEGNIIERHWTFLEVGTCTVMQMAIITFSLIGGFFYKNWAISINYGQNCFSNQDLDEAISSVFDSTMIYLGVFMFSMFTLGMPFLMILFYTPGYFCGLVTKKVGVQPTPNENAFSL